MFANGNVAAFSTASSEHSMGEEVNAGAFVRGNSCPSLGAVRRMSDSQLFQSQHKRRYSQVSQGYQDVELDPLEVMFQRQELTKLRFLLQYIQHHYPSQVHEATAEYIRYRRQVQLKLELERRAYKAGVATQPAQMDTQIHSRPNSVGGQTPPRCRSPARSPVRSPMRRSYNEEITKTNSLSSPFGSFIPLQNGAGGISQDMVTPNSIYPLNSMEHVQSMDYFTAAEHLSQGLLSQGFPPQQVNNHLDSMQQQQQAPMEVQQPQTQLVQDMLPDNFVEQLLNDDLEMASLQDMDNNQVEPVGSNTQYLGGNLENMERWSPGSVGSKKAA